MAKSKLVGLVFEAWNDLDQVIAGVSPEEMVRPIDGGSPFAWTVAHVTQMVDRWVNVRFQDLPGQPVISLDDFGLGASGTVEDWPTIQAAVNEARHAARKFLQQLSDLDLDITMPYDGSIVPLRQTGLTLRYALLRICAHHYLHIGEIAAKRVQLGHNIGQFPGMLLECL